MVAALLELDHQVNEAHVGALDPLGQGEVVLGQNVFVILLLLARHVYPEDLFHLGR